MVAREVAFDFGDVLKIGKYICLFLKHLQNQGGSF
jgi:hypothetical protein